MNYLWTPWRSTYMKQTRVSRGCIFCDAAAGSEDQKSLVVYRGQHCFVILNRYPYTSGHLMVAPYAHVSRLSQVDEGTAEEMMRLTRFSESALGEVYSPDGINLGMNMGEAAGAGIEQHIHMHILPRWKGDANFMTSVGQTRIIPEMLTETWDKLHRVFQTLRKF
ncbi:MAG: HIT family protein [Bryobacteraceae bacterium]